MENNNKKKTGFALMDRNKHLEICSAGGKAAQAKGKSPGFAAMDKERLREVSLKGAKSRAEKMKKQNEILAQASKLIDIGFISP